MTESLGQNALCEEHRFVIVFYQGQDRSEEDGVSMSDLLDVSLMACVSVK